MSKYLIHTYPKRLWYVEQYLIPSMLEQGIEKVDITIYNDSKGEGNLRACMNAFASCTDEGGTWHLQDDVIICKHFKELTELYDYGLVCGFCSLAFDGDIIANRGAVKRENMWFSFPCIRIPNDYARECADWVNNYIIGNFAYEKFWKSGRNDDWCFREYLKSYHKDEIALNLAPNLVDHIDYLLGGGSGGQRPKNINTRALYWWDKDLVVELEEKINARS